jgi:hypothetical protein
VKPGVCAGERMAAGARWRLETPDKALLWEAMVLAAVPWLAGALAAQRAIGWAEATGAWSPLALVVAVVVLWRARQEGTVGPSPAGRTLLAALLALALVVMAGASAPALGDRSALAALLGLLVGVPLLAAPALLSSRAPAA